MNTFEFLSQYLASPIVAHRNRATLCLFQETMSNPQAINQFALNLQSRNFDVVLNSLKVLQAVGLRDPRKVASLSKKIINLGKETDHFGIANLCKDILANLESVNSAKHWTGLISKKLTPKILKSEDSEMFFDNCDHFLEYSLGGKDYKYELSHICTAFRYDCKKASKQVFRYMKTLGYKKGTQYWKERPSRWRHDFEGDRYETKLQYYAKHAIKIFLMWCIKNLPITIGAWEEVLIYERKWDPSLSHLLVEEKPSFIRFTDLQMDTNAWLKKRIKKADAYELFYPKVEWIPLYENTNFRSEDKSFDRYVTTCFIRTPIGKLSRKIKLAPIYYSCRGCYISELPIKAKKKGWLTLDNYSGYDLLKGRLAPSYGIVSEDFDDYVKLFPAPEIIEYFKLTQKKNSLEYSKNGELVIRCINWRSGYHRDISSQGEDRFELANYGHLLMIKAKYLKKYLKDNDLKLIAVGNIWKRKVDKWSQEYDYKSKNSRHKWLSFEIIKLLS